MQLDPRLDEGDGLSVLVENGLGATARDNEDIVVVEVFEGFLKVNVGFDGDALAGLDALGGSGDGGVEGFGALGCGVGEVSLVFTLVLFEVLKGVFWSWR